MFITFYLLLDNYIKQTAAAVEEFIETSYMYNIILYNRLILT